MSSPLTLVPPPPKANEWQKQYLAEWRALIRAQRKILDAQEYLLNQQEKFLTKLEADSEPKKPTRKTAAVRR
jgi:hypothetical protein